MVTHHMKEKNRLLVMNNPERRIRIGVIGCSRIAKKSVLSAIKESKNAEIGIIGSRNIEKSKVYCEEFGCTSWGSYEEVINDESIDLIYISLPNSMHEEWTIKAAEKGKHVWCEKPSTTSYKSAKKMVEACKDNNVRLFEGFMFRYHPQQKLVRDMIRNDVLGGLLKFQGIYSFPFPSKESNLMNKDLGGGALNDSASYPIYASRMIFCEEPNSIFCRLTMDPVHNVDVNVDILLNYSNDKVAYISSTFGSYYQCTYSILGSKARLVLNRAFVVPKNMQTSLLIDTNDEIEEITIKPHDHFLLMIDDFCKEIAKSENKKNHEGDLLSQARVLEGARISHREQRPVMISEID